MVTNLNSRANINTTQHRLKTALAKNKARKQDFNTRFQGTSDAEPTSSWKNELIKGHCKISNDYKSLAACARMQRKAGFDGNETYMNYKSQGEIRNRERAKFSYETLRPMDNYVNHQIDSEI